LRRGKLWGREEGWKNPGQGKRKTKMHYLDVFGFHPQNGLISLILNWCLLVHFSPFFALHSSATNHATRFSMFFNS
jgi:hypothetical protein